ncbi:MAG TPA: protein kinase [Acidobacteriota bacterium]|nr:protein kinase [Acidobacteriota bacterium]
MTLSAGTMLGPYEIISIAGSGGMGEVYCAKDNRLDRTVAIKVLPSHLSSNSELRQRFEREAKAISNLNHPHICTLYDVGHQDGMDFLIMEYLDGETMATRLKKGALPMQQTLTLSVQIAEALDKAHRAGIVHRDLKPGNIMITKSGIKLLDFGLAKFQSSGPDQIVSSLSALATQGRDLTAEGTILGTLQYMSPEQLEGKDTDARTDIFAFGSVIYEMLTGRRAFEGKSQASLIAAILEKDPVPMNEIQPMTPPALDRIVRKCLEKDPDQRWQSAADLTSELKWLGESSTTSSAVYPVRKSRKNFLPWIIAAALAIAGAFLLNYLNSIWQPASEIATSVVKGDLEVPLNVPIVGGAVRMAISSDGKTLAYVGISSDQKSNLYVRHFDQWTSQKLDGTEGAWQPFFSPDNQWIGFVADSKLKKIPVSGGSPITLYDRYGAPRGATWGPNNTILFSDGPIGGLKSIDANGGEVRVITKPDPKKLERSHRWPQFLPDGKTVLFNVQVGNSSFDDTSIEAFVTATGKRHLIYKGGTYARYVKGQLIFCRNAVLYAAPFDEKTFQLKRKPVQVLEGVVYDSRSGATQYAISDSGTLVYQKGSTLFSEGKLMWIDMKGTFSPLLDQAGAYLNPRFSPDGQQLAMQIGDVRSEDIWIYHFVRGTLARLTFNDGQDVTPVWTPDGQRVTYSSWRDNKPFICEVRADGSGQEKVIYQPPPQQWVILVPNSWSPDGRYLTISGTSDKTELISEIFIFDRNTGKAEPFFRDLSSAERDAVFSPNGRWIAYATSVQGKSSNIYVRPFDNSGGKWQVSSDQGHSPRWSRDGRQLFYRQVGSPSKMWVVDVNTAGKSFEAGRPRLLFSGEFGADPFYVTYDVHPDGKRFVMWQPTTTTSTKHLQFVFNWFAELPEASK